MGVKLKWRRNKWYLVIHYHGKRISRAVGTDRRAAERVKAQIEAGLLMDGPEAIGRILGDRPEATPTLAEFGRGWIGDMERSHLKESTKIRYTQSFRDHILDSGIGKVSLSEISYSTIKKFIRDLQGRYSARKRGQLSRNTIRNTVAVLRMILAEAEAEGFIKGNPAANKKLSQFYKAAPRREEIKPFTIGEVHQVEESFRVNQPWFYPLVLCLFRTGLRAGEARGLRWTDVNLTARKLEVKRAWSYGRAEATPKTASSRRTIDLSRDLVEVLKEWKAQLREYWLREGIEDPGLVFPSVNGLPFDLRGFQRRYWNKAQEDLGLDVRRVHDTRHTFATILISKRVPITRVAYLMGHASVKTTLQFYAHYLPSDSDSEDISAALDRDQQRSHGATTRKQGGENRGKLNVRSSD